MHIASGDITPDNLNDENELRITNDVIVNVLSAAERTVVINDGPNLRPKLAVGKNGIPDLNLDYRLDDLCDKETEDNADDVLHEVTNDIDTIEYRFTVNADYEVAHMIVMNVNNGPELEIAFNSLGRLRKSN